MWKSTGRFLQTWSLGILGRLPSNLRLGEVVLLGELQVLQELGVAA
jgi:hypothetical protein